MTLSDRPRPGFTLLRTAAVAAAASLLIMAAAGCAAGVAPLSSSDPGSTVSSAASPTGQPIVVRFGDKVVVPATLADTDAGRDFAALLPVTVLLRDPMGQAKSGRLPAPLPPVGAAPVTDPDAGGIYYVPGSQTLAVFYDDLGQTVPSPGLIRLGAVDGDLASVASAGNRIRVLVDLADSPRS